MHSLSEKSSDLFNEKSKACQFHEKERFYPATASEKLKSNPLNENLGSYSLNENLKSLCLKEKEILHEILLTLRKIDQTMLYLQLGYPSLFEYLVKEIGYSAASAQRRIDAARLMNQVPDLGRKIHEGSLNLSQVSKVQQALRIARKSGILVSAETKQNIMKSLEHKSIPQTEQILAEEFQFEIKTQERSKIQRDSSTRIELCFSVEEMNTIDQAKALLSNTTGTSSMHDLILELARRFIKSKTHIKTNMKTHAPVDTKTAPQVMAETTTDTKAHAKSAREEKHRPGAIKITVKKTVLHRDQGCQFKDLRTGNMCGSKFFLQFDHIHERQHGGTNDPANLRLLCGNHHRLRHAEGT